MVAPSKNFLKSRQMFRINLTSPFDRLCNRVLFTPTAKREPPGSPNVTAGVSPQLNVTWKCHINKCPFCWLLPLLLPFVFICLARPGLCYSACVSGPASPSEPSEVTGSLQWFLHLLVSSHTPHPKRLRLSKSRHTGGKKKDGTARVLHFVSLNWLNELNRQNNSRCLFLRVHSVFFVSRAVCLISVGIICLLRHPWLADSGVSDFGCGTGGVLPLFFPAAQPFVRIEICLQSLI